MSLINFTEKVARMAKRRIGLTEGGRRCGEDHPNAKLTDRQVDQIREWHETGMLGYRMISKWCLREWGLTVPRMTVRDIVLCRRRYAVAMQSRAVCVG